MTVRIALALTTSCVAIAPAIATGQEAMSYETGQYEFAEPLTEIEDDIANKPTAESVVTDEESEGAAKVIPERQDGTVFVSKPTIQFIDPSDPAYRSYETDRIVLDEPASGVGLRTGGATRSIPVRQVEYSGNRTDPTYVYVQQPPQVVYVHQAPAYYDQGAGGASRVIHRDAPAVRGPVRYGYDYQSGYLPAGAQIVAFDRTAWLGECRARLDTYGDDSDRGEIIGALLGAGVGGIIGNRIAGRGNRTAGTLIGAGAGALAGMAAGDAIEDRNRRPADSYGQCVAYLDDYMQRATASAGSVQYAQGGQYMLVPVTVAVPQKAVYRDGTPVR